MAAIFRIKPDIPFFRDDSQLFIPRIIAMVMVLVTFMCLIAVSLGQSVKQSSDAQSGKVLVQIPAQEKQAAMTANVKQILESSSLVKKVELIGESQIKKQMQPWLGDMDTFEALPVPQVIRVTWKSDEKANIEQLRALLATVSSTIQVDAPSEWAANFSRFSNLVQMVLLGLSSALIGAAIILLAFTATTSLKLHHRTVSLLHSIGAHDAYIASQFQANAASLTFKGAALGCMVALLLFAFIGLFVNSLKVAMLPDLGVSIVHILVVVLLPFAAGVVGFITARFATLRYLNQFL